MSTATVDYSALAAQNGAISSTPPPVQSPPPVLAQPQGGAVDYNAMAAQHGAISSTAATTDDQPGWLDREIPLTSYGAATESGVQSIARGVRSAVKGTMALLNPVPQSDDEKVLMGVRNHNPVDLITYRLLRSMGHTVEDAAQVSGAIKDINESADPLGAYAKVAQNTAGEGAGQALTALATEGVVRGVPAAASAAAPTVRAVTSAVKDTAAAVRDAATTENIATTVGGVVGGKLGAMAGEPLGGAAAGAAAGKVIGKALAKRIAARAAEETAAEGAESASEAPANSASSTSDTSSSSLQNALGGPDQATAPATAQETPEDFVNRVAGNGRAQVVPNAEGKAVDAATGKPLDPGVYRVFEDGRVTEVPKQSEFFGGTEDAPVDLRTAAQKQKAIDDYLAKNPDSKPQPQTWQRGARKGQPKTYKVFDQGKWVTVPVYK